MRREPGIWENHLERMREKGVGLYLEGRPSTPEEIASVCSVCEDNSYMPDFVLDDAGSLREIRYDKILYR